MFIFLWQISRQEHSETSTSAATATAAINNLTIIDVRFHIFEIWHRSSFFPVSGSNDQIHKLLMINIQNECIDSYNVISTSSRPLNLLLFFDSMVMSKYFGFQNQSEFYFGKVKKYFVSAMWPFRFHFNENDDYTANEYDFTRQKLRYLPR